MAEGILGILKYLHRNTDLDLEEQRREQEIATRGEQARQTQAAEQENLRRAQDIQHVTAQKEMFNALREKALIEGKINGQSPMDATAESDKYANSVARERLNGIISSGAMADVNKNLESSALSQYNTKKQTAQMPAAGELGQLTGATNLETQRNALTQAGTAGKVLDAISGLAPAAADVQQRNDLTNAQILGQRLGVQQQFAIPVETSAQEAGVAENKAKTAGGTYSSSYMRNLDPGLAAQTEAAKQKAEQAESGLITQTGGLLGGKAQAQPGGVIDMILGDPVVMNRIRALATSALVRTNPPANNASPAPITQQTLPNRRQPVMNVNTP